MYQSVRCAIAFRGPTSFDKKDEAFAEVERFLRFKGFRVKDFFGTTFGVGPSRVTPLNRQYELDIQRLPVLELSALPLLPGRLLETNLCRVPVAR
jgi:hypothetical protein